MRSYAQSDLATQIASKTLRITALASLAGLFAGNIRYASANRDDSNQSAAQIGLAILMEFYARVIGNLFDGYGVSYQTDNRYRWEVHERKPSISGIDQLLTPLFSMLVGYAAAGH